MRILLDTNIYDKLADDGFIRQSIADGIAAGSFVVVVSPIISDELQVSPFRGVPAFFPVKHIAEAIAATEFARADLARVSGGQIYDAHRGTSKKSKDSIIAETADSACDVFVSEDNRCRNRVIEVGPRCQVLSYEEFKVWINK